MQTSPHPAVLTQRAHHTSLILPPISIQFQYLLELLLHQLSKLSCVLHHQGQYQHARDRANKLKLYSSLSALIVLFGVRKFLAPPIYVKQGQILQCILQNLLNTAASFLLSRILRLFSFSGNILSCVWCCRRAQAASESYHGAPPSCICQTKQFHIIQFR